MGYPSIPVVPPPSDGGGASDGKSSRALTGDIDILSRISPDGTPVYVAAVAAAQQLVGAPAAGYVRVIQRAMISDLVPAAGGSTVELYVADAGGNIIEMLDCERLFVAIGAPAQTAKARLQAPIALRGAEELWCTADNAGEAGARWFDVIMKD